MTPCIVAALVAHYYANSSASKWQIDTRHSVKKVIKLSNSVRRSYEADFGGLILKETGNQHLWFILILPSLDTSTPSSSILRRRRGVGLWKKIFSQDTERRKEKFFKKRCSCNTFATIHQILLVFIVINSYYQMEPTQNLQDKIERMSV